MLMLSSELVNEASASHVRNAAGLALKNALSARVSFHGFRFTYLVDTIHSQENARQVEFTNRWLALDVDTRNKVKQDALMALGSSVKNVGTVAAQIVSAIGAVELPVNQWMELIEILLGFVNNATNTNLRVATLQAIGFLCETIVRAQHVCFPLLLLPLR